MEEPKKKYDETRLTMILTAEQRRELEEIVSMSGMNHLRAILKAFVFITNC
jgi:hypothetical protein